MLDELSDDRFLTPKEVGDLLGIGKTKTWELINSGEFPVAVISSRIKRVPRKELMRWIENRATLN